MILKAFLVGGLICGLVQILMDRTKLLPGRIMVLLVCLGVVAGVLGVYKPLIDEEGFIGIFKGGFNASSIGITASLLLSYLASLIFNPKMKQ